MTASGPRRSPPGPSRIIKAVYDGSATTLPVAGEVTVTVPAKIGLSITPRVVPWSHYIDITGHLNGGYVPPDGVALRLLVRYTNAPQASDLVAFRTNRRGQFRILWSYHSGRGIVSFPFWVATTATETDYAFAAGSSRHIVVTFGRRTPRGRPQHGRRGDARRI